MLGYPHGQLQRNLERMQHWIDLGVKGFVRHLHLA